MRNITAYTEPHPEYPAYVSVNEAEPDTQGRQMVSITVRSRGHGGTKQAVVELSRVELVRMATDIIAKG